MKTLPPEASHPSPFKAGDRSPLRDLHLGDSTKYIKIDPAHTFAIDGIGKDFLASSIIMLARAGHFGNGPITYCWQNAYANFIAYCNAYKKSTSISEFSFSTFKLHKIRTVHQIRTFFYGTPLGLQLQYIIIKIMSKE